MSSPTHPLRDWRRGAGVLLFAAGAIIGLLAGELIRPPRAVAQIPDQGLQLQQVQSQSNETNQLLRELVTVLRTETLKVRIVEGDKAKRPTDPRTDSRP